MKSQSLKFFPRESKLTTQEQLFMADFNISNKERVSNQKLEAFAVYILLRMKMSDDDDTGYFLKFDQDLLNLLSCSIGTDNKFLTRVVKRCLERGLFDKVMFNKYQILTSPDIQDKYFFGKQRCTKIRVIKDYLYGFIYEKYDFVNKKCEIVNKNGEIVNKNKQTTQDNTNTQTNRDTQTQAMCTNSGLNLFLKEFPNKAESNVEIPSYVDFKTLTEKIKASEFLRIANNLKLSWFVKKENYEKVISGQYDKIVFSPGKNKTGWREYSQEELNDLYTNLDEINIGENND